MTTPSPAGVLLLCWRTTRPTHCNCMGVLVTSAGSRIVNWIGVSCRSRTGARMNRPFPLMLSVFPCADRSVPACVFHRTWTGSSTGILVPPRMPCRSRVILFISNSGIGIFNAHLYASVPQANALPGSSTVRTGLRPTVMKFLPRINDTGVPVPLYLLLSLPAALDNLSREAINPMRKKA